MTLKSAKYFIGFFLIVLIAVFVSLTSSLFFISEPVAPSLQKEREKEQEKQIVEDTNTEQALKTPEDIAFSDNKVKQKPIEPPLELTENQQQKYDNLTDQGRAHMSELVKATQEAQTTLQEGAQQYFDMIRNDEKFKTLDAEMKKNIESLNQQLKKMNQQ